MLVDVNLFTDNMGNSDIARKNLTTKMPVAAILMELNLIAEVRGLVIDVSWVPRLQNEEADALTNADFRLFTPSNRVHIDLEKIEFIALQKLLQVYEDYEEKLKEQKQKRKEQPTSAEKLAPEKKRQATAGKNQRPEENTAGGPQRKKRVPEWKRRVPLKEKDPW